MFKVIVLCCLLSLTAAINTKYLPPAISTTTNVIRDYQPQQTITRTTTQHQPAASVEYQKNFYIFTAPAEERKVYQQPSTTVFRKAQPVQQRKNVIIINAPATTNTIRRTHAQPIAPSTFTFGTTPARTTHTYSQRQQQNIVPIVSQTQQVLHQQPARKQQIVYQQRQQQPVVYKSRKPEVHFLKYRTNAEADQIQQRILQQFGFTEADINRSIAASGTQKTVASPVITLHGNNVQQKHNAGNVINLSSASAPVVSIDAKPISREYQQTNVNSVYLPPSQNSITTTSITNNNNNEANDKNYARNYLPPGKDVQLGSSYLPLV